MNHIFEIKMREILEEKLNSKTKEEFIDILLREATYIYDKDSKTHILKSKLIVQETYYMEDLICKITFDELYYKVKK